MSATILAVPFPLVDGELAMVLLRGLRPRQDVGLKVRELVLELFFSEGGPTQEPQLCTNDRNSQFILEFPFPKDLNGQAMTQQISQGISALPPIGAARISIAGMGMTRNTSEEVARS